MAISLPPLPLMAEVTPQLVTYGADLTPALGGPVQRIRRFGSRYSLAVTLPPMEAKQAAYWVACLLNSEAEGQTLRLPWPQPDIGIPADLALTVTGADQTGTVLNVSALPDDIPANAFFSVPAADGREYLYSVTQAATASQTTLVVGPLLRAPPVDGAALNFGTPVIEGFAASAGPSWKYQRNRWTNLSFTITEDR